jgi:hypothetical protein
MNRLSAPDDYSGGAIVHLEIPSDAMEADRALLRLDWTGDTGRAYIRDRLISDHFWHGRAWDIDLTPHRDALAEHGLRLELLPWSRATGVWVDPSMRSIEDGVTIKSATVIRVGKTRLRELAAPESR